MVRTSVVPSWRWRLISPRIYALCLADGRRVRTITRLVQPGRPVRYRAEGHGHVTSEHDTLRGAMAAAQASIDGGRYTAPPTPA